MGTFHSGKGELHGITVVVDCKDDRLYVGRCDTVLPEGVVLLDADMHEAGEVTKAAYLEKASKLGFWPRIPRIIVPTEDVASVKKLADHV